MSNWFDIGSLTCFSAAAARMKVTDLKRWGLLHKMICDRLGIDISGRMSDETLDLFYDISTIISDLTDKLGRLPRFIEFMQVWSLQHPEAPMSNHPVLDNPVQSPA